MLSAIVVLLCSASAAAGVRGDRAPVRPAPIPDIPDTGFCELPRTHNDTGITDITCYGPTHLVKPGEAVNVLTRLEPNPYPEDRTLLLITQSVEVLATGNRRVPLTELYYHHFAASYRFIGSSGPEYRGASAPFPAPYGRVVNGSMMANREWRQVNLEFVSQLGVALEDRKQCHECWCDEKAQAGSASFAPTEVINGVKLPVTRVGSFLCCRQCPSALSHQPPTAYRMQYNLTYRVIEEQEHFIPLDMIVMYASGWLNVEYQIPEALGPNSTHVQVFDTAIDELCPQQRPMQIVRCTGHQHFGAKCMSIIDLETNTTICTSCPVFGTDGDVPGNELGYVVHEEEVDVIPAYTLNPGSRIRIQSVYDASEARFGLMGLMWTWIAGMSSPCRPDPGPDVPAQKFLPVGPELHNFASSRSVA